MIVDSYNSLIEDEKIKPRRLIQNILSKRFFSPFSKAALLCDGPGRDLSVYIQYELLRE